jgi:protein-tyrosine phosphatase
MTTTERLHPIAGTYNLRDTGGYPAATGTTRWGKLFRSDALHQLTDDSRDALAELGVTVIVDLRDATELASAPSRLDGLSVQVVHTPIYTGAALTTGLTDITLAGLYERIVAEYGDNLALAVRHIARSGDGAVLVHCTAGKDRTGLVIALALRAAGVSTDAVIADYAATEANLRGEWVEAMLDRMLASGIPANAELETIIGASPPELIAGVLHRIDSDFGSAEGYLVAHGLTNVDIQLLRDVLVETAPTPASPPSSPIPHDTPSSGTPRKDRS